MMWGGERIGIEGKEEVEEEEGSGGRRRRKCENSDLSIELANKAGTKGSGLRHR